MSGSTEFDREKLSQLILYFSRCSGDDPHFGATKLNKLLFVADFWAYGHFGRSITGTNYVHQSFGPTPDPALLLPLQEELVGRGALNIANEQTYYGPRKRPVSLVEPDMSLFTEDEVALCDEVMRYLGPMNAKQCSNWTHDFPGWKHTQNGQEIPYYTIYLWEENQVNKDDVLWAQRTAIAIGVA